MSDFSEIRPGVYDDIPEAEYHKIPYVSKSRLWMLKDSPAHLKKSLDGEYNPSSDAIRMGSLFDAYLLDPDLYASFPRAFKCESVLKSGNRSGQNCGATPSGRYFGSWRCGKHIPKDTEPENLKEYVLLGEEKQIEEMIASMRRHPEARKLLDGTKKKQITIIWDHEITGMRCKARIDAVSEYDGVVCAWDLKSTEATTKYTFNRIARDKGYFLQASMYLDGCEALDKLMGRKPRNRMFQFLVCSTKKDKVINEYPAFVYEADYQDLRQARNFRDSLIMQWADCLKNDSWPTPNELSVVEELYVPEYART